jgi:uncharacterized protein (DUF885 family)
MVAPMVRSWLPLAFTSVFLVACGGAATAPSTPAPAPVQASTIESVARRYLALSPAAARGAGLHEYDGKIASVSEADITRHIVALRELQQEVARLEEGAASDDERLDCKMLAQALAQELFDLTEVESWRTRPLYYSELFSVDEYIVRDYAPKEQRAHALLEHVKNALAQVPHVTKNLRSPLPEPVVKTSIDVFAGFAQYLRGDVQTFLEQGASAADKSQAKGLALALAGAADQIAQQLEQVELPKADQSHVLGRQRYEHLLRAQEALTTPIEELEQMAEADLQKNKAEYEALAAKVTKSRPPASALLDEARKVVEASRAFVVERKLVTLPIEPHVEVKETPPFMRWNSAFLNSGGPLEPASLAAYYYITLPDPSWPPQEQAEYVMSRGEIVSTSVHEVFPGHYLQGLWQRSAPTFVQQVFGSYSFGEGWAHYVEQMMVDEGFAADLPEARLGQLSDALLRDCRFVASIGIHVHGLSVDDARKRFVEDCKQDEASARQQAVRGTFDPGYFAYTLGKLQILSLREEAKKKLGARFELGKFHDALLAHGAPPVPLIQERVLAALDAR